MLRVPPAPAISNHILTVSDQVGDELLVLARESGVLGAVGLARCSLDILKPQF